jgi:hypothetical protein
MATTMQRAPMMERGTTSSLNASDQVEGTEVYDARGKRIGKVERLVIDKASDRIGYALASFEGFLGIGADHYPIPSRRWTTMKSSADTAWTSPKSNSKAPQKSNKGKAGSMRTGRRSIVIGSNPHRRKSAKLSDRSPNTRQCEAESRCAMSTSRVS